VIEISAGRLDVAYEARFTPPSVNFAIGAAAVLKAVYSKLASRWTIASNDVSVAARVNEVKLNEVRVRLNMFNGAATLEIDADKIGGFFRNARFPNDLPTIRECLKIYLGAIADALPDEPVSDHTLKFMMFAKLLQEPKSHQAFLTGFLPPQLKNIAGEDLHPAVKFEIENKETKSVFAFELMRAYVAKDDLFMSASLTSLEGSSLSTIEQRMDHLLSFINKTWDNLGLKLAPVKDAS
jgi:hypothetical protein